MYNKYKDYLFSSCNTGTQMSPVVIASFSKPACSPPSTSSCKSYMEPTMSSITDNDIVERARESWVPLQGHNIYYSQIYEINTMSLRVRRRDNMRCIRTTTTGRIQLMGHWVHIADVVRDHRDGGPSSHPPLPAATADAPVRSIEEEEVDDVKSSEVRGSLPPENILVPKKRSSIVRCDTLVNFLLVTALVVFAWRFEQNGHVFSKN